MILALQRSEQKDSENESFYEAEGQASSLVGRRKTGELQEKRNG
jgi:hypothetical protein